MITDTQRWDNPINGLSRKQRLKQRQDILKSIREDFYQEGFLEAETPLLIKGTCPDLHIESFQAGEGYLATSTEYQIKRMMAGGFDKVFTLTKNFRAFDQGRFHSHEFTMLEWARTHKLLNDIEEDCIRFIRKAAKCLNPKQEGINFNGYYINLMKPWQRLTVREAFKTFLKLENLEDFSLHALLKACKNTIDIPESFQSDNHLLMSFLLDQLQKHLGFDTPAFLQEWPAFLTTSAPICAHDPFVAERSELYIAGIEVADGFPFLTDSEIQKKLFCEELEKRREWGKPTIHLDSKYLKALEHGLPPGAGMALGVDRLVMILTDAIELRDVQAFSWDEL